MANRHLWAGLLFVVVALLNLPDLTRGWQGIGDFVAVTVMWGAIAYLLGSHRDRDHPGFWRPLVAFWTAYLVAVLVWSAVVLLGSDNDDDVSVTYTLLGVLVPAGLLVLCVDAARRTAQGLPWRREPPA